MKNIVTFIALSFLFTSCISDDDSTPVLVNQEEVITTVIVSLTRAADGNTITFRSVDTDGEGPTEPVVTVSGNLETNTVYEGTVQFLNETESPAENITEEVEEEADEHQVFFTTGSGFNAAITYGNFDSNNNPLGTNFILETTDAGAGNFTVTLRHEPTKPNDGTLNGAGGETDAQVVFPVTVE